MATRPVIDISAERVLLGDEAVAAAALDAGISAAYAYPGTPATEIQEFLLRRAAEHDVKVSWCANEKTAFEQALGASLAGCRSLVSMKHVGLNVAADPFINGALVSIEGGLVLAVADDPGMHSSQNEQDSRFYADLARIVCLEPADQLEAYRMTREAFELSERFRIPVMVRLVTRLAHSRAVLRTGSPVPRKGPAKTSDPAAWTLLPVNARRRWEDLLARQEEIRAYTETCAHNVWQTEDPATRMGVLTAGLGRNYFLENVSDLGFEPVHLHVGAYPLPEAKIRRLAAQVSTLVVIEDGYPFIERRLRGLVPHDLEIRGKESGHLPPAGELDPDVVRAALGLPARPRRAAPPVPLPSRPPQLCPGCPHGDVYAALNTALQGLDGGVVTSDIGCYTLGAFPPYRAIESCVCMGASVGMAKGASEAGLRPVVAVIGDSTFLHSGVTPLMDAVACDTDMTLVILDNEAIGMTGGQPTLLPASRLEPIVRGLGVAPEHCRVLEAHPRKVAEMAREIRKELLYPGLSVIIAGRECLERARKRKRAGRRQERAS